MTTSISNASAEQLEQDNRAKEAHVTPQPVELVRTLASRFIIVTLCVALVLSALAYGTVHYWSLAVFEIGACALVLMWAVDAWRSRTLRFNRSALQLPLMGLFLLGLVQLLPLGNHAGADVLNAEPVRSLSLDPYSTRLALVQIAALFIYFAAALAFIDSPKRLRLVVRVVTIFGFALALLGLMQYFTSPGRIYWLKDLPQSMPFGPFYNRHHFAGYMELCMALPLGLLFSGAIEREKRPIYLFAVAIMGISLVMTNSRGGLIALVALVLFLVAVAGFGRRDEDESSGEKGGRMRAALTRAGMAMALVLALVGGALLFGGEEALSRMIGTVNSNDPTTGRAHFWSVTLQVIQAHPILGSGLGSYGLAYTQYDSRNGLFRLEQAHNDYLQLVSDAGLIGLALGILFFVLLFRKGFARHETTDTFRRGVATGALGGCFAVLVHSFFDFTLHTTANALLFLVLTALATINGRVEQPGSSRRRRRHRRRAVRQPVIPGAHDAPLLPPGR
jgi:O-antigen ligase